MTDTLLRDALSALKTKIEALASLETATAEEVVLLSTAVERIAGQAGADEVEQVAEAQQAALVAAADTALAAALQSISDALAAADAAISARREGGTFTGDVTFSGEINTTSLNEGFASVTSTTNATTIDCEAANVFLHTLTENTTFTFSNPPATGTAYGFTLKLVQDATARTVTWPASVKWAAATAPTISTGSGEVDVFVFFTHDGGTNWYGFTAGQVLS